MESLFLIGGTLLVIGGSAQLWIAAQSYRQGRPWRGSGLIALAMTVYGGLTAMGLVFNGTVVGTPRWTGQIRPLVDTAKAAISWR